MFGILSGIGADLGWGMADFFAAVSARKIGNLLTFFWMQVAGLIIAAFYLLSQFGNFDFNLLTEFLPRLFFVALFQIVAYIYFYKGLEKAQVSLVSPIGACWRLVTAVLSIVFYHEAVRSTQVTAMIIIVSGIILISTDWTKFFTSKKNGIYAGVKEGIIAMLGWGVSLFLIIPASRSLGWFLPTFSFRIIALLLLFGFLFQRKVKIILPVKTSAKALTVLVGIMDIIGHFSYNLGVSGSSAAVVAAVSSAFPLITILLALIVLKEKLQATQTAGIAAIIGGLILISI